MKPTYGGAMVIRGSLHASLAMYETVAEAEQQRDALVDMLVEYAECFGLEKRIGLRSGYLTSCRLDALSLRISYENKSQ